MYVESTDSMAPLRSAFDCWESHSACQAAPTGQPVAAGDQQISDVAVMPLMKLTQHSLPSSRAPEGLPLCMEHGKHSPSLHAFMFQCASDLMAPQMHCCIVYSLVVYKG